MTQSNSEYKKDSKLITAHYAENYEHYYNAIVPPIFMNSLNVFEHIDAYYDCDTKDINTYVYGRVQNPTVRIVEEKIAALEHGAKAALFASGMAATTTAILSTCKMGSNVVCLRNAYGPVKTFLDNYCVKHMGMTVTYVKGDSLEEYEQAVTDKTDLIMLESPSSVVFSLQDIRGVVKIAHQHGAKTIIDNTFCTPIYQQPLDMGVDLVMHTLSKYMGGHSDLIGGVLASKDEDLMNYMLDQRELIGGIIGPVEAWLVLRGLRSLEVRIAQHNQTALKVAKYLENHPKVKRVYYPGLKSHPQYELMKTQQTGNTGLLSFEINGTVEQAKAVVNNLSIFKIGVSWGGFESLACMPQLRLDEKTCNWLGAGQGIIRLHCGLEGAENLIADLASALEKI
ncbi:trans-sulfuration enzyme family protein [Caproiciproducens sp. LBM24188]